MSSIEVNNVDYYTLVYKKLNSIQWYSNGRFEMPHECKDKDDINSMIRRAEFLKDLLNLRREFLKKNPGCICEVMHYTATVIE